MTTYIWSIDDAGAGENLIESMSRTCEFFDARGVKSTWFVIPKPHDAPLSSGWRAELAREIEAGHDMQLHGLTHADCYEFGPPAWPATSILSTLQSTFDARRDELLARYTVEKLQARIHTHGIADDYEHTFRLIDAVIEQVERTGGDFATFDDVIRSGALAAAASEHGPDLLPV
jgi:hypothetical protein